MAKVTFVLKGEETVYNVPIGEVNILQAALNKGLDLDHACGGVGMCSTCRVVVKDGMDNLSERNQNEELFEMHGENRLGCQCVVNGDVTVELPQAE